MKKNDGDEINQIKKKPDIYHYHEEYTGGGGKPTVKKAKKQYKPKTIKRTATVTPTAKRKAVVTPNKKKVVEWTLKSPRSKGIKLQNTKGATPEVKKVAAPQGISPGKGRKRVRRLITARDGSGIGAKRNQSFGNKVQRTKDKIKRAVDPWMGKEQYYSNAAGKEVDKKTYKALKKAY